MQKRFTAPYFVALLFVPLAAGLRLWSLVSSVDADGLPVMHLSMACLFIGAAVLLVTAAILSRLSPGRSGQRQVLHYGRGGFVCAVAAAVLILVGTVLEFADALMAGPGISAPILCLLGLLGSVCLFVTAWTRRDSQRKIPAAEILPVVYVLIKLLLNFKRWSVDPIILDYCVQLFALIFSLMAFLRGAGFCLDQGRPRRNLFWAMGAVYFCAAALMDGVLTLQLSTIATYGGFLLWQLPLIWDLGNPSPADPKQKTE